MPLLTNPSSEDVGSYRLGVHLSAGGTQEVSDEVAGEFAGHAFITVTADVAPTAPAAPADETPVAVVEPPVAVDVATPAPAPVAVDGFQHVSATEGAPA